VRSEEKRSDAMRAIEFLSSCILLSMWALHFNFEDGALRGVWVLVT